MTPGNEVLFRKFNDAFASGDISFLLASVTDRVEWTLVGAPVVRGKDAFADAIAPMAKQPPAELTVSTVMTHGRTGVVEGTIIGPDETGKVRKYAFCDVYQLNKSKDGKIQKITSYVIEVKE